MEKSEWKLVGYNASDHATGGDCPVQPGGWMGSLYLESEEEMRAWFTCWTKGRSVIKRKVEMWKDDTLLETHYI